MTSPSTSSGRGYDGGKGGAGVAQWIINQIPPHRVFIEAFAGGAAVARAIRPAENTTLIEIDSQQVDRLRAELPWANVVCFDALTALTLLTRRRQIDDTTFLYLDPPYLLSTRSQQRPIYAHEFSTIEQHRALLALIRRLPCMIAISGYWSALYELELASWRSSTFRTIKRSGETAEEWLWMNYPVPLELHDYRYLGKNFRERERIKRKKARWTNRLRTMPDQERYCLMEAIGALRQAQEPLRSGIAGDGDSAGGIVESGVAAAAPDPIARSGDVDERQGASAEATMGAPLAGNDDTCRYATPQPTMLEQ